MTPRRKLMAVASGGGHWMQLLRLVPAFVGFEIVYVTTDRGYRSQVEGSKFYRVNDANRWDRLALVRLLFSIGWIVARERPDVIVSTGAAPGYLALRIGRALRARTIWVDSIANAEELSLSGAMAGRYADLWLTQWPHLAAPEGPHYAGSVL